MKMQQDTSSLWQYVADLRPYLCDHVRVIAQVYRAERWYILENQSAGTFTRFNAAAYEIIGRFNGDYSVQEVLYLVNRERSPNHHYEQQEILTILAQLQQAEVLRNGLPLAKQDVLKRYAKAHDARGSSFTNPLAIRIPLFDPNRLLNFLAPFARICFSAKGFWIWSITLVIALLLLIINSQDIFTEIGAKTLSPMEIMTFWLLYPVIKVLHELGHGMAIKAGGGESHETGIIFLLFMPIPYINASASWGFRDKRRRALVGAAGIFVELFLAALGLFVWLLTEPGIVHECVLNVMLISGVSTLLFNGNPLLRYDGYYVLSDIIEIPNLGSRASRYYLYLIQKYVLGVNSLRTPVTASGESPWFIFYGFASPLYRLFVLIGIALYLPSEFLIIGVVLAAWAIFKQIVRPLFFSIHYVFTSPRLEARRLRAISTLIAVLVVCLGVLQIPISLTTQTQGVVWFEDRGELLSPSDSFVLGVSVPSGHHVRAGELLISLEDNALNTRQIMLQAHLSELRTKQLAERTNSRVRGAMVADDIKSTMAELEKVNEQINALQIKSPVDGRFILDDPHQLKGQFVTQGKVLGYVIEDQHPIVRAVIKQADADLLRAHSSAIEVLLPGQFDSPIPATLLREVPSASVKLPSVALGAFGGGDIRVDMRDQSGLTATENVFQLDIALPAGTNVAGIGGRAYVRIHHGDATIWGQWMRSLQQLFISHLLPLTG